MSRGLVQWHETDWAWVPDCLEAIRADLAKQTPAERMAAAQRYLQHEYGDPMAGSLPQPVLANATAEDSAEDADTSDAATDGRSTLSGPDVEPLGQHGVYNLGIFRTTGASDPLVPEPGP